MRVIWLITQGDAYEMRRYKVNVCFTMLYDEYKGLEFLLFNYPYSIKYNETLLLFVNKIFLACEIRGKLTSLCKRAKICLFFLVFQPRTTRLRQSLVVPAV